MRGGARLSAIAVLFATLVLLGSDVAADVTPLASGLWFPRRLVVNGGFVYWVEDAIIAQAIKVRVNRIPTGGGSVAPVAQGCWYTATGLAVDGTSVYWSATSGGGNGDVCQASVSGGSTIDPVTAANQPSDLAVDEAFVYWAEDNGGPDTTQAVRKVSIGGGEVSTVTDRGAPLALVLVGSDLYFSYGDLFGGGNRIARVSKEGGLVTDMVSTAGRASGLAADATHLYWAEFDSGVVQKMPLGGGPATTLASGLAFPWRVAVDSTHVYWVEFGLNGGAGLGAVKRVPIGGGTPETLASGLTGPNDIATDGATIYWSERGTDGTDGTIKRLAKGTMVASTDVPKSIPDPGQVESILSFADVGMIEDVTLDFQFTHQCERDLTIDLFHPDGTVVRVMDRGLQRCSGVLETFTSHNPDLGPFFRGKPAGGIWHMVIRDNSPGFSGTFDSWSLAIRVASVPPSAPVPVVLVHGWCGSPSAETWGEMRDLLRDAGLNADHADYGSDVEGDLARLAGRLNAQIERVLGDASLNPTGVAQVDIVAHSMGGIVARALIAGMAVDDGGNAIAYADQVRRLVEIATPNYGIPFGAFEAAVAGGIVLCDTDFGVRKNQANGMKFGSHFLWVLHTKWSATSLGGERKRDVLTIVGIGNQFGRSDFVIPIESAALADVNVRSRYVDRAHFDSIAKVDAEHETFKLVKHFLLTGEDPPEAECGADKCTRQVLPDTPGMLMFRLVDAKTGLGINLRTAFVTTVDGVMAGGSGVVSVTKNADPGASTLTIRPLAPSPPSHVLVVDPVTLRYVLGEIIGVEITAGRTTVFGELALERE